MQRDQHGAGVASDEVAVDGRELISRLADELLPVLIARLEASALGELEVRQNGWRVRLRRPLALNGRSPSDEPLPSGRSSDGQRSGASGAAGTANAAEPRPGAQRLERQRAIVSSPAVGYFLPRDGIGVGSSLRNGDALGHIDVLGVRQEVVAPADGVLSRLEVEPGQAVEYGQPIARLEPDSRESRG